MGITRFAYTQKHVETALVAKICVSGVFCGLGRRETASPCQHSLVHLWNAATKGSLKATAGHRNHSKARV